MKKVSYKVTGPYELLSIGSIVKVFELAVDEDSGNAILLHPALHNGCGSISIAKKDDQGYYVDISENCYVNINSSVEKKFHKGFE